MNQENLLKIEEVVASQNTKERDYWVKKMSGNPVKSIFPYDYKKDEKEHGMEVLNFDITGDAYSKLMVIINGSDPRLHMFLAAALAVLLARYSGNKDIIIGTPIYTPDVEGKFINTLLALRNRVKVDLSFKELLLQVRETIVGAVENQNYPIKALPYQLKMAFPENDFPLFDVVYLLENIQDKKYIRPIRPNIVFAFRRTDRDIKVQVEYNSRLYRKDTVERMGTHLVNLLNRVVFNIDLPVGRIELMSGEEKKRVLYDFNDTNAGFPGEKTLHRLFEEQVEKTPGNVAVGYNMDSSDMREEKRKKINHFITYRELNQKTNQLAHLLRERGLTVDTLAGLMVGRSIEMIIGVLGVLKAGGAYLPLDPGYPRDRLVYMLKESDAPVLVTTEAGNSLDFKGEIIRFDSREVISRSKENPRDINTPRDLAYAIYTSGSTGNPKGVLIEHRNAVAYTCSSRELLRLTPEDTRLQQSSFSFDQFVEEVYPILSAGGKLIVLQKSEVQDPLKLIGAIEENRVTIFSTTPAVLREVDKLPVVDGLRRVLVGGDTLKEEDVSNILKKMPVDNFYGPTETTAAATHYHYSGKLETASIPIGKPKSNYRVYILDGEREPLPVGVSGEIYISGDGVGRGYLNRPELTQGVFVPDTFIGHAGEDMYKGMYKMYRTGDCGRWLPGGDIEFVGRIDRQVKIRGFRIELGEIEYHLERHRTVREAVVIETGNNQLCAYIVQHPAHASNGGSAAELVEYLGRRLPDYMIPMYFMPLEKIPLTPNGKLDRNLLPEPKIGGKTQYIPPRNEIEAQLVDIWSDILGVEKNEIGINSNFFELGGHSLRATVMASKVHDELHTELLIAEVFNRPTIKALAEFIEKREESILTAIQPCEKMEYYPVSSAQKRMFMLHQLKDESDTSDNMHNVMLVEGKLDVQRFETVVNQIIKRHETLRTSFELVEDTPVQFILEEVDFQVRHYEIKEGGAEEETEKIKEMIEGFIEPFDLGKPPLLRVGLIELSGRRHILMYELHHIITDGRSIDVFFNEFINLYGGVELPGLRIQYRDFTAWQNELLRSEVMKRQEEYWLGVFSDRAPVLNMPTDFPRPDAQSFEGEAIAFSLDTELTSKVKKVVREINGTLHMVFLAIFNVVISKYSGQEDIVVGTSIAGRTHADLKDMIGFFVNTLAMRNYPKRENTFKEFLEEVKQNSLKAYENQDYQFDELVRKLDLKRDASRNPLFDVHFTVHSTNIGKTVVNEEIGNLSFKPYSFRERATQFDIIVHSMEIKDAVIFNLVYCTKLFKRSTMEKFIADFMKIASIVIEDQHIVLKDIEVSHGLYDKKLDVPQLEFGF